MTAAAYTPAPWRLAPSTAYTGSELNVDAGTNGTGGFVCVAGHRGDAEAEANARLITAAPDLLEALKTTAGNIRSLGPAGALGALPSPYINWLAVVDAAIAKAEGRPVLPKDGSESR